MTQTFNAELRSLLELEGPFISLYLDIEAATEDGPEQLSLRWRSLRAQAIEKGADEASLKLLDDLIPSSQQKGDGLVAFVEGSSLAFRRYLSRRVDDRVSVGALPDLVPLLEWQQDSPRYAVVTADREGADIHVISGDKIEDSQTIEGDDDEIKKVAPGGWSQRRFQRRAEDSWDHNAKQVAHELDKIIQTEAIAFVVIAGDVRAIQFLKENVSERAADLIIELEHNKEVGVEDLTDELEKIVAAYVATVTETTLQRFQEERGQEDLAVEGIDATLDALGRAQVNILLITRSRVGGTAWFSPSDLTQASSSKNALTTIGVTDVVDGALDAVLVRAALGTGARVYVLPDLSDEVGPAEGVGGLLRYA
ncbi:MAG: Vms1/Ankzf1 family peptidyl-tRNA hydrolase [Actinomycetota bacterium]